MANLTQLRLAARQIFDEALRAVDAGDAVRRAVKLDGSQLVVKNSDQDFASHSLDHRSVYVIALGKAAGNMTSALAQILGPGLAAAVITTNDAKTLPIRNPNYQVFAGGHPEPNEQSLAAAQAAFELLHAANEERAIVIFLVSGGGSAMLEWPGNDEITLADLRLANRVLVNCGASIQEINAVRRSFSAIKGGRLAQRAPNCDHVTLIISDVPRGQERDVASGPTVAPRADGPDPHEVIAQYNLRSELPESIIRAIETVGPAPATPAARQKQFVLLDNVDAVEAAARAAHDCGFPATTANEISDSPIEQGCSDLCARLQALRAESTNTDSVLCLISGGEFSCPVKGDGIGGRNLETALRLAIARAGLPEGETFVALCAGTDGIDGNSPAAGAIVDTTTIQRARTIGLDAEDFLNRSDAYSFFVALGDVITTGPTGANVRDLRILLSHT